MSERLRRAVVVGFDYYGRFLANLVNERSSTWRLRYYSSGKTDAMRAILAARTADVIVSFGGPSPNAALVEVARRRKIPVIVIWAGSDVTTAAQDPGLLEVIKQYGFTNISDGPWLVDELRELGIDAQYVPVTAIEPNPDLAPLPSKFNVLTYLPEPRRAFYGERVVYELAREFPEIPFRVVGKGDRNPVAPKNVEFLGYVDDMAQRIDDATVILRLPEHDGKSMLVVEAMARGRHVIWNYDFPGVHHAERSIDAARILRELREAHEKGSLELNLGGYAYVAEHFNRPRLAAGFEAVLQTAVHRRTEPVRLPRKRLAIGGLNLFTAQVAEQIERDVPEWEPIILRVRSRLEVVASMFSLASADVWYSIGAPIGDRWLHLWWQMLRTPRVIHWVGSDINALHSNPRLRAICRQPHVQNLAEADWTIEELRRYGIDAALAPLPPRLKSPQITPLPKKFTVLLYIPKIRGDFYGRREYERMIRAFAQRGVKFIVVGGGEFYAPPDADVERLGWIPSLDDVYERATVLIRFTKHDGLSLMALEALTCGRYVLWSQPFPYSTTVRTYEEIENGISELLAKHDRGELAPQTDVANAVTESYNPKRCIERISAHWERAVLKEPPKPLVAGARS